MAEQRGKNGLGRLQTLEHDVEQKAGPSGVVVR